MYRHNFSDDFSDDSDAAPEAPYLERVKMKGDGNCLFHALAHQDGSDGAALRAEVAEFLVQHAADQGVFADSWLEEADVLGGDPRSCWGGDTSIVAWSLLKRRRAKVHWYDHRNVLRAEEKTHPDVLANGEPEEGDEPTTVHLMYNGKDHYDLLRQCDYGRENSNAPAATAAAASRPDDEGSSLTNKRKEVGQLAAAASKKAKAARPKPRPKAKTRVWKACQALQKSKKESENDEKEKEEAEEEEEDDEEAERQEDVLEELSRGELAAEATHPRRKLEDLIKSLAA